MVPTLKLIILILLGGPMLLAGEYNIIFARLGMIYYLILLCFGLLAYFVVPCTTKINIKRKTGSRLIHGRQSQIELLVTNNSKRSVKLWLIDNVPDEMQIPGKPMALELAAGQSGSVKYQVLPKKRGRFYFNKTYIRVLPALGILARQFVIDNKDQIDVYPDIARFDNIQSRLWYLNSNTQGHSIVRKIGEGSEFESLRFYVPGDSSNRIDWKATARRRSLIVKNFEPERQQNVLVAIDAGRSSVVEFDGKSRLDYYVESAIMLASVAMSRGDWFSLLVFSDKVDRYLPPIRNVKNLYRVIDQLYDIQPKMVESDYNAACHYLALKNRKRSMVCLMTDVIDKSVNADIIGYMARFKKRHLPVAIAITDTDVKKVANQSITEAEDLYSKAVAIDITNQRHQALLSMTRSGVLVLDVEPNQLTTQLVEKYIEIKQKSML